MGGSRGREHVYLWLIHVDVWQKPTEFCEAIILKLKNQLKKKVYRGRQGRGWQNKSWAKLQGADEYGHCLSPSFLFF